MFRIGEFSKIAQTPITQLRYYDQIGLFQPAHIDRFTNYRYYSAAQLPDLNRILALKDLGLSLDQIRRLVEDDVSAEEIRGMLALKKMQAEQAVRDELNRLRAIEARLRQVEDSGELTHDDIILKVVAEQPILSIRQILPNLFDGVNVIGEMMRLIPPQVDSRSLGHFAAVIHGDAFRMEKADVEMGFLLKEPVEQTFALSFGEARMHTLPAAEAVISAVRIGPFENGYATYAQLGHWVEANGYALAGPPREIFIDLPPADRDGDAVTEIQFPVTSETNRQSFLTA
ncbi:MAG: MerR family transcriptional regulator [Ardenticatenaceae bacterium]|nr:MerR family transcriptional regulator [Ardenticatenaceae bacterium]